MRDDPVPSRIRTLVIGGGIHGAGILHDLASRGWNDIHLVDKSQLGAGTSSASTKLVHGGLRYLRHISQFSLVYEALKERTLLLKLLPELVNPIEILIPIPGPWTQQRFLTMMGLALYENLAGKRNVKGYRRINGAELAELIPGIRKNAYPFAYSYWDAQTDDLGLVHRVADSAQMLGAGITENCPATSIKPSPDGWEVEMTLPSGKTQTVSALYVINAMGPWANRFLERNHIAPTHLGVADKGVHLILPDMGLKAGMFLNTHASDGRIFFLLPWLGKTLVGTTETPYDANPDNLTVKAEDVDYLLSSINTYLETPVRKEQIEASFAGLRWLIGEEGKELTGITREHVIGRISSGRGALFTIYGGKLTSYRRLSESLGDQLTKFFGEFRPSRTMEMDSWAPPSTLPELKDRFQNFPNAW